MSEHGTIMLRGEVVEVEWHDAPSPSPVVEDDSVYVVNEHGGLRISVTDEMVEAVLDAFSIYCPLDGMYPEDKQRKAARAGLIAALRVR